MALGDTLPHPGAVMVVRDRHAVAAHYGSAAAELAVCVTRVGAAVRPDLDVLELTGGRDWLSPALGAPALAPGAAVRVAGAWCCLVDPARALLVGAPVEIARCQRLAQQQAVRAGHFIRCVDRSATTTALTLVGPRVPALLATAGLPTDLPASGVRACRLAGRPAMLLHERAERHLLLVAREGIVDVWAELLQVGRPLGLAFVGLDALERLAAVDGPAIAIA